jgi:hypothetical protein
MQKKVFVALAGCLAFASMGYAQKTVTFVEVLDVATDNTASVFASTYSMGENKFIASAAGTAVRIYNGDTGVYESDLDITGVPVADATPLGLFALAAGEDGSIFGWTNDGAGIWQWSGTGATAVAAGSGPVFARFGQVIGTGNSTVVGFTGIGNNGVVELYSTTDDVSYTLLESIDAAAVSAKSCFAINSTLDVAWGMGDTSQPVTKAVKSGTWAADAGFVADVATNSACNLQYDEVNDVVFAAVGANLYALDGTTGAQIGTIAMDNAFSSTPGYGGSDISVSGAAGTLWMVGRGATASNASMHKWTYTVSGATDVNDWTLYH